MFLQHAVNEGDWKAYNIEIAALDSGDPSRSDALDRIGAGLVHRFAGCDVLANLGFRDGLEADARHFRPHVFELTLTTRTDEADTSDHAMDFSGEVPQHTNRVGLGGRLFEDVIV